MRVLPAWSMTTGETRAKFIMGALIRIDPRHRPKRTSRLAVQMIADTVDIVDIDEADKETRPRWSGDDLRALNQFVLLQISCSAPTIKVSSSNVPPFFL